MLVLVWKWCCPGQNTGRRLTNSGGTTRQSQSSETKSSLKRRTVNGGLHGCGESSFYHRGSPSVNLAIWFFCRFKAEVKTALESFVEKEDEFIKQVMQRRSVLNESFSNASKKNLWVIINSLLVWDVTAGGGHHPCPGEASSRGPGVSLRGLFSKDAVAVSLTVAFDVRWKNALEFNAALFTCISEKYLCSTGGCWCWYSWRYGCDCAS